MPQLNRAAILNAITANIRQQVDQLNQTLDTASKLGLKVELSVQDILEMGQEGAVLLHVEIFQRL